MVVDTYQAASGAGKAAMDELIDHSRRVLDGERPAPENHPQSLAFNIFPHIDSFRDDGYTKEEWKMLVETQKIMGLPNLRLSATCVRVPVAVGHSEALHIEFERPMSAREAREVLENAPGIVVVDDPLNRAVPSADRGGRPRSGLRRSDSDDVSNPGGIALWVVADNLRKGAALNAVQIAELLYGAAAAQSAPQGRATATATAR